ncbi:hypothetical protein ZEAMMB73_Zm00001d041331 [Zea mays]|uniref:Uncharacterized protein n=2 Tax=Poaceae TaxID=4479 RepID=A0A1D6MVJ2_MAIZE|nr:hypothetical protein ZEAMMB73_Zm00001d041331 [Zea mays]ONM32828.1 hypothetical protein ZEAMMB73_Zm00001d041331 [Zea mays]
MAAANLSTVGFFAG